MIIGDFLAVDNFFFIAGRRQATNTNTWKFNSGIIKSITTLILELRRPVKNVLLVKLK